MDKFDCAADLMREINHAQDNEHHLVQQDGKRIPAVRTDYLYALIEKWIGADNASS